MFILITQHPEAKENIASCMFEGRKKKLENSLRPIYSWSNLFTYSLYDITCGCSGL